MNSHRPAAACAPCLPHRSGSCWSSAAATLRSTSPAARTLSLVSTGGGPSNPCPTVWCTSSTACTSRLRRTLLRRLHGAAARMLACASEEACTDCMVHCQHSGTPLASCELACRARAFPPTSLWTWPVRCGRPFVPSPPISSCRASERPGWAPNQLIHVHAPPLLTRQAPFFAAPLGC